VLEAALPVLALELVVEAVLLPATAVLVENGLAPPEPQPTIEAMARAAMPNLTKTLEVKFTRTPSDRKLQLTEMTVGLLLLWLYRGTGLGVEGKFPRYF
jgi:hypothetical protein